MSGFLTLHLAQRGFYWWSPDRVGRRVTFYTGLAAMACGLGILSTAPAPWLAVAAAALTGFGFSLPWPSIASTVLNRAAEDERASSVGVLTACVDLFVGLASVADGTIAHRFGYAPLYWLAIAGVGVAATVGWRVTPRRADVVHHEAEFEDICAVECPE